MNNRLSIGAMALAIAVLVCAASSMNSGLALAQRDAPNLEVRTSVADASYQALKELSVMVSVIRDGEVVKQQEVRFNSSPGFSVPAGLYDVRLEGEGMQTLIKRGIHVNESGRTDIIGGPMRAGTGVKIIEFATGGLSREEIAARLAKLETAVADLQKRQAR